MKKQILALLFSATVVQCALPFQASAAITAQSQTAAIVHGVNFREQPSVSSRIIRQLKTGESLQVIDKPNAYWLKVKDASGRTGYVSSSSTYVSLHAASGANPSPITTGNTDASANRDSSAAINAVISTGMKYLGTPYEYGSSRYNTTTFDCSDFVRQAFLEGISLKLPADSRGQASFVKANGGIVTDWHQLKRGDLMFFMSYKGSKPSNYSGIDKSAQKITHVGIYLGNGQVLHTYSVQSGGVKVDSIAGKSWEYRFLFGGSAL